MCSTELQNEVRNCRRSGVPILILESANPPATVQALLKPLEEVSVNALHHAGVCQWDCVRGLRPLNSQAVESLASMDCEDIDSLPLALSALEALPDDTVLICHQAHRHLNSDHVVQQVCNLRDHCKSTGKVLVLLTLSFSAPPELRHDVVSLVDALPSESDLRGIVDSLLDDNSISDTDENILATVQAVTGLTSFGAEQVVAMSVDRETGIDLRRAQSRTRGVISEQKGLSVPEYSETFGDVVGLDGEIELLKQLVNGAKCPRLIVHLDEAEKALAGTSGDTTGISSDAMDVLLRHLESGSSKGLTGIINVGPPGTGKSMLAKALSVEASRPLIEFDINGMKESLVGNSQQNVRQALSVLDSFSGGNEFWVLSSNNISSLRPEFLDRFGLGQWFVDLPSKEARIAMWMAYCDKYDIEMVHRQPLPNCSGWNGREIRNCCSNASRLGISLVDASQYVSPIALSDPETIEASRKHASGRYLSASNAGLYRFRKSAESSVNGAASRKVRS